MAPNAEEFELRGLTVAECVMDFFPLYPTHVTHVGWNLNPINVVVTTINFFVGHYHITHSCRTERTGDRLS